MAQQLAKRHIKALRGDLDVKRRKGRYGSVQEGITTIRNPDLPKWDYKTGGYTRSIDEQESYMKEKAQKKADKKFKDEAGFGDYALELGGYASAAYLYFKLPKIAGLAGKAIRGIGKLNKALRNKKPKLFNYKGGATQRMWHVENIVSKNAKEPRMWWEGKVSNLKGIKLLRNREAKAKSAYQLRSLLTGSGADKLEKDILKKGKPTATEKLFLKGKQELRKVQQKGEIITKKEIKSKGKEKLLKKQNYGTGNISKGNVADPSISKLNDKIRKISMKQGALKEPTGGKLPQIQSKGKKQLLSKQSTRSKGGSAGQWQGGGGKRVMGIKSPWEWIKRRLD